MELKLFIEIFIKLLKSEIRFPRSGPKPLICKQCLLIPTLFKTKCKEFIIKFGEEEENDIIKHRSKNGEKSDESTEAFITSLNKIIEKLNEKENCSKSEEIATQQTCNLVRTKEKSPNQGTENELNVLNIDNTNEGRNGNNMVNNRNNDHFQMNHPFQMNHSGYS